MLACSDYLGLAHLSTRSPWNLKARPDLPIWRVLPIRNMEIIVLVIFVISVSEMYVSPCNADKIVDIASRCASYWIRLRGDWMRPGGYRIRLRGLVARLQGILDQARGSCDETVGGYWIRPWGSGKCMRLREYWTGLRR